MCCLTDLSIQERNERAQVIECLMLNPSLTNEYGDIALYQSSNLKLGKNNEIFKSTMSPSRLSTFLKAALVIRHNYLQWCKFLDNSSKPPIELNSLANDELLVFFLFWCDAINVISLNPYDPFLICDTVEDQFVHPTFVIRAKDGKLSITKKVLEKWKMLNMPGKDSSWGKNLTSVDRKLSDGNSAYKLDDLNIGSEFYLLAYTFDLTCMTDNSGNKRYTEEIILDMNELVMKCSTALAFDDSDCNTLEIVRRLFPQFPELVGEISKHYVLTSRIYDTPISSNRREILDDIFDPTSLDYQYDERTPLWNSSILSMIESHPELYARWAIEPRLRVLYRKYIDPVSSYD